MYRCLTLARLQKQVSRVFGHSDFVVAEAMLARVHLKTSGSVIAEESFLALREFFAAGLEQFPEEMPFRRFADAEHAEGFRAMCAFFDSFWHRAISSDFGDIFVFCDDCYERRPDKTLFFWFPNDDTCDSCGKNRVEDQCIHCGERTVFYRRWEVPHFAGKIGFGVEWDKFLGMRDIAICSGCLAWGWPIIAVGDQVEIREHGSSHYPSLDPTEPRTAGFLEVKEVNPLEKAPNDLLTCARCEREIEDNEICVRDGATFVHFGGCPPRRDDESRSGPPAPPADQAGGETGPSLAS
ncbi:MAG: hypothetical protein Q8Q41_02625 [bacterium]|nr:hypothetical protein [bacterium]